MTDAASQVTLLTEEFVRKQRLSIQKSPHTTIIEGIGDSPVHCRKMCSLTLRSRISNFEMLIDCLFVPTNAIKYRVSIETVRTVSLKMPDVELAEAELSYNFTDILVGAEYVESYLLNKTIDIERITLRNSRFGWLALSNASDLIFQQLVNFIFTIQLHFFRLNAGCRIYMKMNPLMQNLPLLRNNKNALSIFKQTTNELQKVNTL